MELSYWYFNKWLFIYNFTCSVIFDINMVIFQRWVNNTGMIKNSTMYLVKTNFRDFSSIFNICFYPWYCIQFGFIMYILFCSSRFTSYTFLCDLKQLGCLFRSTYFNWSELMCFICLSLIISGMPIISIYIFWWFLCHLIYHLLWYSCYQTILKIPYLFVSSNSYQNNYLHIYH